MEPKESEPRSDPIRARGIVASDMQSQTPSPVDGTTTGANTKPTLWMKLLVGLVILGLGAGGVAGIKTYLEKTRQAEALGERGVETDARVSSVTEISGRRIETYHRILVSYDPEGSQLVRVAEVLDCPGHRWESGLDIVRVVYLPDDPDVIRLAACRSSFDANVLPGILGIAFLVLMLFMLWRLRRFWRG